MQDIIQSLLFLSLCYWGFFRLFRFYSSKTILDFFPKAHTLESDPCFSVIIPARNEAKRLPILLKTLSQQTRPPLEIIVADDDSQDATVEIVRKWGCRVVHTNPKKWVGKSAACYQGAQTAKGDYLLFLDADVSLSSDALEYLSRFRHPEGVVSVQPYHRMERQYEQGSLYFNLVAFLGLDLGKRKNPFQCKQGFFGPCMMIARDLYFKTGGHTLARKSLIEDMTLGQALAKQGVPLFSIPHAKKICFRMYGEGFRSLWDGWTKNLSLGAQKSSVVSILIITGFIASSLGIPIRVYHTLASANYPEAIFYSLIYVQFAWILHQAGKKIGQFQWKTSLLFPFYAFFFVVVFLRSFIMKIFHIPIRWRNRKVAIQ